MSRLEPGISGVVPSITTSSTPSARLGDEIRRKQDFQKIRNLKDLRIIVFGTTGVGKTALVSQFVANSFVEKYEATVEDTYKKVVHLDNKHYMLTIIDTAGIESFKGITDIHIKLGDGYILTFALNDESSFEYIKGLMRRIAEVKEETTSAIILVGNKSDLESEKIITPETAGELISRYQYCQYYEASARGNINVDSIFHQVIREIINRQKRFRFSFRRVSKNDYLKYQKSVNPNEPDMTPKCQCLCSLM